MPGLLSASGWVFNLADYSHDSDSDEDDANTKRLSSDADVLRTMDLSSREDAAHYKPNPWAIAKLNAACRPLDISSKKMARVDEFQATKSEKPRQITISQAFLQQTHRTAPYGQSLQYSVTPRKELIGMRGGLNAEHERVAKAEGRPSHTNRQDFHDIPIAPADPATDSLTMLTATPMSGNNTKVSVDALSLNVLEPSIVSVTPSSRPLGQTRITDSSYISGESTNSCRSFRKLSEVHPVASAKNLELPLVTDTDYLNRPVLDTAPPVLPSQDIVQAQYTIDGYRHRSVQNIDPESKLSKASLHQSITVNSGETMLHFDLENNVYAYVSQHFCMQPKTLQTTSKLVRLLSNAVLVLLLETYLPH